MFSRLEPILRTITRRAESTDTRLAIRRDESKDQSRSKGGPGDGEFSAVPWEDMASVSTASLRTFLQSLLGVGPAAPPALSEDRQEPTTMGARAAGAYQSMGRAVHDRNVEAEGLPIPAPAAETTTVLGADFGEAELARVRRFVSDLIDLERSGVHELIIQRNLAFMDGIEQGILLARAAPKPETL